MTKIFDGGSVAGNPLEFDEGGPRATRLQGSDLSFDPRTIIFAVKRNLAVIAAILVASLVLGVIITLLMNPQFAGQSRILIEQQTDQIIEGSDARSAPASYMDADRFLQTQVDVLRSRAIAEQVLERENLAERPEFFEAQGAQYPVMEDLEGVDANERALEDLRQDQAVELLRDGLAVSLPPDSRLVSIEFISGDPVFAAELSNAFAQAMIESNLSRKFESSSYAREFLGQQLKDARAKLESSERDLNQFSRAAGLIRVTGGQGSDQNSETTLSVTNNQLVLLNSAAAEATAQRIAAQQRWQSASSSNLFSIPEVMQNSAVQRMLEQRSLAEANLAQARSRYLEDHPNVIAARAQVDKLDQQVTELAQSIKNSIRLQYAAEQDREQAIKQQVADLRSSALDEQDRGVEFNVLKRVAETDRALYNTLLTRFNELNATAGSTSNNISLVDVAEVPRKPVSPSLILNLLAAMVVGLLLSGGFVFFREQFDDSIRNPDDIEKRLGLPVLGLIPRIDQDNLAEEKLDPKSPLSEAYSSMVTNVRYSTANGIPQTLLITSSQAAEGKTTTASKIAEEIAGLGRKTLLIDSDLRKPTLHKREGVGDKVGFTALLAGEAQLEEVIFASNRENLCLMTALPVPPDPIALLSSPRFTEVLDNLRNEFDCVVLDAPPLLGLADATTLAAYTDASVLIIDATKSKVGGVRHAQQRLEMVKANILGAVLTKFDPSASSSRYQYYGSDYYAYESDND